jgi:hypothetical protein
VTTTLKLEASTQTENVFIIRQKRNKKTIYIDSKAITLFNRSDLPGKQASNEQQSKHFSTGTGQQIQ